MPHLALQNLLQNLNIAHRKNKEIHHCFFKMGSFDVISRIEEKLILITDFFIS